MKRHLEYRCPACGRLQFKGYLPPGAEIQVVCWHNGCHHRNTYIGSQVRAVDSTIWPVEKIVHAADLLPVDKT